MKSSMMKLLAILFFFLAFISSPVLARGPRCSSSTQCDYESVCDNGYCLTIDEMFAKYEFNEKGGRFRRNGGYGGEHSGPRVYDETTDGIKGRIGRNSGRNGQVGNPRYYEFSNYK